MGLLGEDRTYINPWISSCLMCLCLVCGWECHPSVLRCSWKVWLCISHERCEHLVVHIELCITVLMFVCATSASGWGLMLKRVVMCPLTVPNKQSALLSFLCRQNSHMILTVCQYDLKGIVHPKMKTRSLSSHHGLVGEIGVALESTTCFWNSGG